MSEPQFSVGGVFNALAAQPLRNATGGRCVMFISAREAEDATTPACATAHAAGGDAAYAVDLDLRRNGLAKAIAKTGSLGPRLDGRFTGISFYGVQDENGRADLEVTPYFSFHRVAGSRLHVGLFNTKALPKTSRVAVSGAGEYWDAARATGATTVVLAPSLDRSQIGLRVAKHMDGVVLVVGAEAGAAPPALLAKAALSTAGANVIGLVYTGVTAPVMAIERLLRQAGRRASASP